VEQPSRRAQQPLFGFGMHLDCAVMEDVGDGDAALGEAARHQETAMTIERFALGAHQTNARPRRDSKQPIQAGNIFGLDRHSLVIGRAIAIERVAAGPTAERFAHCDVTDAGGRQRRRKRLLRKPRAETRVRRTAHVGDRIRSGALQQRQKVFGRNV
jgi:hypothetical protein